MKFFFFFIILIIYSCQINSTKNHQSPIDSLNVVLTNDPNDVDALVQKSKILFESGNYIEAKNVIDKAYKIFKNDMSVLFLRGEIYFKLNKTSISKKSWERCISNDPNNIPCREKLTNLYCLVRDKDCLNMIDTLSKINQGMISLDLISHLRELKKYAKSIKFLEAHLEEKPNSREALSLLSLIHSDTTLNNDYYDEELAEIFFKKIIELYPDYFQVYYNYGMFYQNKNDFSEAVKIYKVGAEIDNESKYINYNIGFCLLQLELYDESVSYFTRSIEIDNSFLLAFHGRAYAYTLNKEYDLADADWKNCLMLNPSYIPALEGLSE